MAGGDRPILIYTTFPALDAAKSVGKALVEGRLAACVNIFPGMTAIYEWKETLEEAGETAMIIKTRAGLKERVLARAKELHPYEVPALLVIEPVEVDADFAAWIGAQTQPEG